MMVTKQIVINRQWQQEILFAALKRYAADLKITIERFPEINDVFHTFPSRLRETEDLIDRFGQVMDDQHLAPEQDEGDIIPEGAGLG